MKRSLLYIGIGMLTVTSCTKEPEIPAPNHPQSANIQLSQAEIERLPLLNDNHRLPKEQVLAAVEAYGKAMPGTITKAGGTMTITDSLVFAGPVTRAGAVDAAPIYAVSFGQGEGFALVGGDKRLPQILAYVEQGDYSLGDNPGFDFLMAEMADGARAMIRYKESLRDSLLYSLRTKLGLNQTAGTKAIDDPNLKPPQYDVPEHFDRTETVETNLRYELDYSYGPLLKTEWWQWTPFNDFRPDNAPAGCVATAMGQIMNYHKHPQGYLWNQYSNNTWGWSSAAAANVSHLMSDIGVQVHMEYDIEGSDASSKRFAQQAFQSFRYHCDDRQDKNISSSIATEAGAGRPVLMRGNEPSGDAHAWVADGAVTTRAIVDIYIRFYLNDQFQGEILQSAGIVRQSQTTTHHNLGWGGDSDGWYDLLFPESSVAGISRDLWYWTGIYPQ